MEAIGSTKRLVSVIERPGDFAHKGGEPGDFRRVLEGLAERLDQGEQLMTRATRAGPGQSAAQLLALQAGIYRYTETVELASKLVDRTGNAVRTTLQSQ